MSEIICLNNFMQLECQKEDKKKINGNGFTFASCNPYDMLYVLHEALDTYKNKSEWQALMKKAATTDFSWSRSAEDYKNLYEETLKV